MKCAVGGTFACLHLGHKRLLLEALKNGSLVVGVSSDAFAARMGKKGIAPYRERERALREYLQKCAKGKFEIVKLEEFAGPAATDASIERIAFGREKLAAALRINSMRRKNGLAALELAQVGHFCGEDFKKVSSSLIAAGKIDARGKRLAPLVLGIGSKNRTKIDGARSALKRVFPKIKIRIVAVGADSKVPAQPFGSQTIKGAINRAKEAYAKTSGADYGIGIESGLFRFEGKLFDIAFCALYDGEEYTLGNSMGFALPHSIGKELVGGKKSMGRVVERLSGIAGIGSKKGAIHFLSGGLLHRREMNEQALMCAFIPRIAAKNGIA